MDRLDQLISAKQAELDRLQAEIAEHQAQIVERSEKYERALIELETLKAAAQARPAARVASDATAAPSKPKERRTGKRQKGRSAGDISHEWRKVLAVAQAKHRRLSYSDRSDIAAQVGIKTKMPNVRERVRTMTENELLTGTSENGFLVTAEAVRRFGLDKLLAA
jgi:TolA-binding protein